MKLTQCEELLDYLKKGKTITSDEAKDLFGIGRCASRIHDLLKAGWDIKKEGITVKNRHGRDCHIIRYSLEKVTLELEDTICTGGQGLVIPATGDRIDIVKVEGNTVIGHRQKTMELGI